MLIFDLIIIKNRARLNGERKSLFHRLVRSEYADGKNKTCVRTQHSHKE